MIHRILDFPSTLPGLRLTLRIIFTFIICLWIALILIFTGCATIPLTTNQLKQASEAIKPYIETLATDWPIASGLIQGALPIGSLPKSVTDKMAKIDKWFQDKNGKWLPADQITLNEYRMAYIAGARLSHMGPIMQVVIKQYAPGLLGIPQVIAVLSFFGLGAL